MYSNQKTLKQVVFWVEKLHNILRLYYEIESFTKNYFLWNCKVDICE